MVVNGDAVTAGTFQADHVIMADVYLSTTALQVNFTGKQLLYIQKIKNISKLEEFVFKLYQ